MRGVHTLFADIFTEQELPKQSNKGRNADLIAQRNECLIDRYFYLGETTGLRYELLVKRVAQEFFLSAVTVPEIINDNLDKLLQLKKAKPGKKYFQEKWQHLAW